MKALAILISLVVGLLCSCSTRTHKPNESARLPLLRVPRDEAALATFEQAPTQSQPWLCGGRNPPLSVADLGLQGEIRLFAAESYLDGGSQEFVLCDPAGHYFVFCTSNPRAAEPAFLLGTKHFTEPQICRVAIGSASYTKLHSNV